MMLIIDRGGYPYAYNKIHRSSLLKLLKQLIETKAGGTIFSVSFIKKNGEFRNMRCRLGVKKGLTGKGLNWEPIDKGYMTVYDIEKKGYRMVNLDTIQSLQIKGEKLVA